MADYTSAAARRLRGMPDPRSTLGMFSRGKNIYNAGSTASHRKPIRARGGLYFGTGGKNKKKKKSAIQNKDFVNWLIKKGYIEAPNMPKPISWKELPFSREYDEGIADINASLADLLSEYEIGHRRAGENFDLSNTRRQLGYKEDVGNLDQKLAGQGILRSGTTIQEQGALAQQFQRAVSDASMQHARQLEDMNRARTLAQQQLEEQRNRVERDRTDTMKELADEQARKTAEAQATRQKAIEQQWRNLDNRQKYINRYKQGRQIGKKPRAV